jgi:pilus assembly protein Flp/PilA
MTRYPAQIRTEASIKLTEVSRLLAALRSRHDEEGQGLAEYALILALIAIVAILSLIFLGDSLGDLMSLIGDTIDQAT